MSTTTDSGTSAATAAVSLGTAAQFAVLAASTVTNTGPTRITGDLGLSPGTSVTGFPPGQVNGTQHVADAVAAQAKNDLAAAYDDLAGRPSTTTIPVELGGTTRTPGVYESPAGTFGITGALTLDAQGDPDAVFVFKAASTLITASASSVDLVNGARAANVFWLVGSSATLGTYSILRGNILALASITVTTGVTIDGRALARNAAVTLDSNTITAVTSDDPPVPTDPQPVALGTAAQFAVLAASTVTNTGPTTVTGDLGLSPGTSVTGFPPGVVTGTQHVADAVAAQAKTDLVTAYDDAAARASTTTPVELGGTTKTPGVYESLAGTFGITGALTLDAQGDPDAVFVFKAASTLITASASSVDLVNGARAANVFWLVGSSATLGTYSILRGNILALASITVTTGVTIDGRALARNAAVTLDSNTITAPSGDVLAAGRHSVRSAGASD
ncbi:ice-binding family protein [Micromonospora sp. NPDC049523]|uniref:ice-binding family protein n=1 Tax=Micromonospora sp. NPDC049523 TaxID=3155921 RepID=UPI00341A42E4